MSVSEAFTLHAVNFAEASVLLNGISESSFAPGIRTEAFAMDGSVDPTFLATFEEDPRLSLVSMNIAAGLAAVGISGLSVSASPTDFYWAKLDNLGDIAAGSVHLKMAMTKGLHFPQRLSARQGAAAELTIGSIPTWDGSNDPVIFTVNNALQSPDPLTTAWTVGPVKINGTLVAGVQNIDFDTGLDFFVLRGDGESRPTFVAMRRREPTIRVGVLKASVLATLGSSGIAQTGSNSVVYFRKKDDCGDNVADGTAEHVSLTIDDGKIEIDDAPARAGEAATVGIVIKPKYDGTNAIVAIGTAVAIV